MRIGESASIYDAVYDCSAFVFLKILALIVISMFMAFSSCSSPAVAQEECFVMGPQEDILPKNHTKNRTAYSHKEIKCVVHVLWDTAFANSQIQESIIEDAMVQLNVDFEGTDISFTLEDIDYTNLNNFTWASSYRSGSGVCFPQYGTQMAQWTNMVKWNTAEYCNIYVAPDFCSSILGFAWVTYIPYSVLDGVWVETEVMGTYGPHLTFRFENETLTHEVGHYCGLHHVFKNGSSAISNCGQYLGPCEHSGDYVCDTPPTKVSQGCPDVPGYHCPLMNYGGVQFYPNNHMDYCPEECRDVFTDGQIERMHAMLEYQRSDLFSDEVFCFGDLDGDCHVGTSDLLVILSNMGCEFCTEGDIDLDHMVTSNDVLYLLNMYGQNCNCFGLSLPRQLATKPEDIHEIIRKINDSQEKN